MSESRAIVSVLGLLGLTVAATAQVEFTHTYPYTGARAVVSEKIGSDPATIYEGAGCGWFVLDGTNLEPALKSGVANQIRAGGRVCDLALTADHVYAAVHRAGITRKARNSTSPLPDWTTGQNPNVSDAWAVNVPVRVGTDDLVFAATNDDYDHNDAATGGKLYMLSADAHLQNPSPPLLLAEFPLGAPAFTLASRVEGNIVTLLVGCACRQPTPGTYASLLRFDFDIANGLPSTFPTPTPWNPTDGSSTVPTFIRDIAIDAEDHVAYVAAYTRGVFKVNLPSGLGGGLSTASGNWPITAGQGNKAYFEALAVHDGALGKFLVVGKGPSLRVQTQEYGDCSHFEPCDDSTGTEKYGISLYDLDLLQEDPSQALVGSLELTNLWPLALSTYERSGSLIIATAAQQEGLAIVKATPSSGAFILHWVAGWNINTTSQPIPSSTFDDLLVIDHNAYAAIEKGVAAFDITEVNGQPAADLFESPVDVIDKGGAALAGCAAEFGFPKIIFAGGGDKIALYEVSGDGSTANLQWYGDFVPGRRGEDIKPYTCAAIPPSLTPDGHPWLITINTLDSTNPHPSCQTAPVNGNGSVRIYRVDLDQDGHISKDTLAPLGAYQPDPCVFAAGRLVWALPVVYASTITLYVGYTPNIVGNFEEPDAGLLVLNVAFTANNQGVQDDGVTVTEIARIPVFEDAAATSSGSMGISDPLTHGGLIAIAFGCHGIASFLIGDPAEPELLGKWQSSGVNPPSFIDCAYGAGDFYATALDGRIYVFDPFDMAAGPLETYETIDQGAFIVPATSTVAGDPQPPAFFMTGFSSGLHRAQLLSNP